MSEGELYTDFQGRYGERVTVKDARPVFDGAPTVFLSFRDERFNWGGCLQLGVEHAALVRNALTTWLVAIGAEQQRLPTGTGDPAPSSGDEINSAAVLVGHPNRVLAYRYVASDGHVMVLDPADVTVILADEPKTSSLGSSGEVSG